MRQAANIAETKDDGQCIAADEGQTRLAEQTGCHTF
jgi:hypothetical protein